MRGRLAFVVGGTVAILASGCRNAPRPADTERDVTQSPVASPAADVLLLAAAKVALPPPGLTPADLPEPHSRGAELEAKFCAQCHALPAPTGHSLTDWPIVTRRMWLRMESLPDSLGVKVPTSAERYEILQYLTTNALRVSGATLPAGRGREAFSLVCSRCHALPDPSVHLKDDWPIVFARMERNMERMHVAQPTAQQAEETLFYLQNAPGSRKPAS